MITPGDLVSELLRQTGDAAHKRTANPEYMQIHEPGYTMVNSMNTPSNMYIIEMNIPRANEDDSACRKICASTTTYQMRTR